VLAGVLRCACTMDLCGSLLAPLMPRTYRMRLFQMPRAAFWLVIHWLTFFHAVKIAGVGIATLGFASFRLCGDTGAITLARKSPAVWI